MIPYLVTGAALVGAALSARWNWWRKSHPGVPVLMYHKVGDPPSGSKLGKLWVSRKKFHAQMAFLKNHGFSPITFVDITNHWDGLRPVPDKPVLITFDDGYQNNYIEAYPILREFGFPATVFVVVDVVGGDNRWHDPATESRVPMLTWAQIKELQTAGWEIGSHTMSHPRLLKLEREKAAMELQKSRQIIGEFLDTPPQTLAYPYGNGEDDPGIRTLAKEAGYRIAVGIHAGKWTMDDMKASPYNLPRIFVRGDDHLMDFRLQLTRGRSRL